VTNDNPGNSYNKKYDRVSAQKFIGISIKIKFNPILPRDLHYRFDCINVTDRI
jgi:hypothetical protein